MVILSQATPRDITRLLVRGVTLRPQLVPAFDLSADVVRALSFTDSTTNYYEIVIVDHVLLLILFPKNIVDVHD